MRQLREHWTWFSVQAFVFIAFSYIAAFADDWSVAARIGCAAFAVLTLAFAVRAWSRLEKQQRA